jgi:hypothetical protein
VCVCVCVVVDLGLCVYVYVAVLWFSLSSRTATSEPQTREQGNTHIPQTWPHPTRCCGEWDATQCHTACGSVPRERGWSLETPPSGTCVSRASPQRCRRPAYGHRRPTAPPVATKSVRSACTRRPLPHEVHSPLLQCTCSPAGGTLAFRCGTPSHPTTRARTENTTRNHKKNEITVRDQHSRRTHRYTRAYTRTHTY